ncbi:MAG: RNA polymerase sigma factor [Lentisphaeraceae bacterium]|nr:RNA polymerase sigma factor [Lentisphaeraceae bacterium]
MEDFKTSKTLLLRLQQDNDEKAWERFSVEYKPFIYSLIKVYGVSHEDSEELVQDVLVKIWKVMSDFLYVRERCKFRTWLARVVKNATINFINLKRNKQKKLEVDDSDEALKNFSSQNELDEKAEKEWKLFIAGKAWENIQSSFSSGVLEVYTYMAEGKSAIEAAEKFSIEENTAYTYKRRVKDALSREIRRLNVEMDG